MNVEIKKNIENVVENILNTDDSETKEFSEIDKTMIFISACLTCAELNTRSLVDSGQITEKELNKFSKKINELRKNYKDLFSKLKGTDVSYAW